MGAADCRVITRKQEEGTAFKLRIGRQVTGFDQQKEWL